MTTTYSTKWRIVSVNYGTIYAVTYGIKMREKMAKVWPKRMAKKDGLKETRFFLFEKCLGFSKMDKKNVQKSKKSKFS